MPSKAPSVAPVGLSAKLREWSGFFRNHMERTRRAGGEVAGLGADLEEYDRELRRHSGISLAEARVLEIGFGTRAARLALLNARARDVRGVDPEVPMLTWDLATLRRIGAGNGWERAAKTTVRHLLFDRSCKRALTDTVGRDGRLGYGRMEFCDAADLELPEASIDLVVSEDVLEHMSVESLTRMLPKLRRWLGEGRSGVAQAQCVHGDIGWSSRRVGHRGSRVRPSPPSQQPTVGHLLGDDIQPNTYLNRLSRQDYRDAFRRAGLQILEERPRHPDLGRLLLAPQLKDELRQWPDDELFSNQVLFVLKASDGAGFGAGGMAAILEGTLAFDGDCLRLIQGDIEYPVVWPAGASWEPDTPSVVLDGQTIAPGATVSGEGGHLSWDHVEQRAGSQVADAAAGCAGPTGEIAFFNIGSEVEVTSG